MTHKGQEHVNHVNYSRDVNINRSKQAQYRTILAVVTKSHVNKSDIFYLIFLKCFVVSFHSVARFLIPLQQTSVNDR